MESVTNTPDAAKAESLRVVFEESNGRARFGIWRGERLIAISNGTFTPEQFRDYGNLFAADEVQKLLPCELVYPTGSRTICPPCASAKSDHDFLVLVADLTAAKNTLIAKDFTGGESMNDVRPSTKFLSLRRKDLNLIVTADRKFYDAFALATRVATQLGLTLRVQRVLLFQAILYGNG